MIWWRVGAAVAVALAIGCEARSPPPPPPPPPSPPLPPPQAQLPTQSLPPTPAPTASAARPDPRREATAAITASPTAAAGAGDEILAARAPSLPVAGVGAGGLRDMFADPRGGRVHEAVDIAAPRGTPVHAVDDGLVAKLFDSVPGGLTVYQFDPSGRLAYYYAHLDRYADGLAEGRALRRCQLIGYVGSTGNASAAAPHLHFAVFLLGPERQWWKGAAINPYPALVAGGGRPCS